MNYEQFLKYAKIPKEIISDLPKCPQTIILGTGGSVLGAQAIISLKPNHLFFTFPDSDPEHFYNTLGFIDPDTTSVFCISKSGETMETLAQFVELLSYFPNKENIRCISQNSNNSLREIAKMHYIPVYDHPDIGGRFSVFSLVGLLPLYLNQMSIEKFIQGAKDATHTPKEIFNEALQVLWTYSYKLKPIADWWGQLVAESLGKKDTHQVSHEINPMLSFGSADQHSHLQLYLEGKKNKEFTFLTPKKMVGTSHLNTPVPNYLNGKTLYDVYQTQQQVTLESIQNRFNTVNQFTIDNEYDLGFFMMKSIKKVVDTAEVMGINPFGQDSVEHGKDRAKKLMQNIAQ